MASYISSQYNQNLEIDSKTGAAIFPTEKRWLKGEEYGFLIRHHYAYSTLLKVFDCNTKHHPNSVYDQPKRKFKWLPKNNTYELICIDGQLYFISNLHLQDFGFPRVRHATSNPQTFTQFGKKFKWKKINYKTLLPKHSHIVAYLVAKTNNFKPLQFMMHAAAHANEFDTRYTQTSFTRKIKQESAG